MERGESRFTLNTIKGVDSETERGMLRANQERFARDISDPNLNRELRAEEKEMIESVSKDVGLFLESYGAHAREVLAHHVHVIDAPKLSAEKMQAIEEQYPSEHGSFFQYTQNIVLFGWRLCSPLALAHALVHEIVHLNSYNARRVHPVAGTVAHQVGLQGFRFRGDERHADIYFNDINEAVTEELTIRYYPRLIKIDSLREEYMRVEAARIEHNVTELAALSVRQLPDGQFEAIATSFSYPKPRKRLIELIKEIRVAHTERFATDEGVFEIFARAAMTGDYKEMATLVESLGTGRFRDLASRRAK